MVRRWQPAKPMRSRQTAGPAMPSVDDVLRAVRRDAQPRRTTASDSRPSDRFRIHSTRYGSADSNAFCVVVDQSIHKTRRNLYCRLVLRRIPH